MHADRPRPSRPEPPEVMELVRLKAEHPELAPAVDMQVALLALYRRVQSRIPTARTPPSSRVVGQRLRRGERLIELSDISLDWSDLRLVLRQTAEILVRHDALDTVSHRMIDELLREGGRLEPLVRDWYAETAPPPSRRTPELAQHRANLPAMLDEVLAVAVKPFLARTVEGYGTGVDFSEWGHPWCPYCGAEPELAVIAGADERLLICGRCVGRWSWLAVGCPWCGERDASQLAAFAARDRMYRVYACRTCRRYLKAVDLRRATRPVFPAVDVVATLPLDAAVVEQGFGV